MNRIFVHGIGAVSPAGWGVPALREVLRKNEPVPTTSVLRPGWEQPLPMRLVPPPTERPKFFAHPRLRRSSAVTQHAVGAAIEALGDDAAQFQSGGQRLGIVVGMMSGSVTYSRRFFEEVMRDPSVASPMLFPETVFNAAASHVSAYLNSRAVNYTIIGDESAFLQGMAIAAGWLLDGQVDGCLVLGAEESDWLIADALRLFAPRAVQGGGAGAVYLRGESHGTPCAPLAELETITDLIPFSSRTARAAAARRVRAQLPRPAGRELLSLGTQGLPAVDEAELAAWRDDSGARIAPKELLGEAFTASAAWQCVAACDAVARAEFDTATVSVVGSSQHAGAGRVRRSAQSIQ